MIWIIPSLFFNALKFQWDESQSFIPAYIHEPFWPINTALNTLILSYVYLITYLVMLASLSG